MEQRQFTVKFNTPAFLGNSGQSGQWRTPPFKHLLREWWRVAWAEAQEFEMDINTMRREEARLFGVAADGQGSRSLVRLRLDQWRSGRESGWENDLKIFHPEVGKGSVSVGSQLYLGYGPLIYDKSSRGTKLKANAAIQAGEENGLKMALPTHDAALLDRALELMGGFGTLGGRSRNGWGSMALLPLGEGLAKPLRDWQDCLRETWPHAIGSDNRGALVWRTKLEDNDWRSLMKELAQLKIELRTNFKFRSGNGALRPEDRHWLSYPVTNHSVKSWGNNARLPNMLRFKVQRNAEGKLYGLIFHMPHLPPREFQPDLEAIERTWQSAHRFLDKQPNLERLP